VFDDVDIATNGDQLAFTVADNSNETLVTASISGSTLTLDYLENQFGIGVEAAGITVRATDLLGESIEDTFLVTVNPVNDAPTAANDTDATDEDLELVVDAVSGVLANDSDIEGDTLTAVWVSGPSNGALDLYADGSFTYTPNLNFNGPDSFTYQANDDGPENPDSSPATVTINVGIVNDDPFVMDEIDDVTVFEDAPNTIVDLSEHFSDIDIATNSDQLAFTVVNNSNDLLVSASISGDTLTLNYLLNQFGVGVEAAEITVRATDLLSESIEDTFLVSVNPVNDAPFAATDTYNVNEDLELVVEPANGVLANDNDTENDPLTAVWVSGPSNGTLELNVDGSFAYTPNLNFNGPDSFTYQANDAGPENPDSSPATVTINVDTVNDAPAVAAEITDRTVDEDAESTTIDLSAVFTDVDIATNGDDLTYTIIDNTDTSLISASINNRTLTLDYQENQFGVRIMTIRATDQSNAWIEDTFIVSVKPVNDAPIIRDHVAYSIYELEELVISLNDLTVDDPDNDYPDDFSLYLEESDAYSIDGLSITPEPGIHGNLTVRVRVNDNGFPDDGLPSEWSAWFDLTVQVIDAGKPCSNASSPISMEGQGQVQVSYTANDSYANEMCGPESSGDGLAKVDLWVKGPTSNGFSLASTDTTGQTSGQFDYTLTQDGIYAFYTSATDVAGNAEEHTPGAYDTETLYSEGFSGYAIIALGDTDVADTGGYTLTVNNVYQRLIDRNFSLIEDPQDPLDHIKYFHPGTDDQIGEDDISQNGTLSYKEALQEAIAVWALNKMKRIPGPLYLLLTGKSDTPGIFRLTPDDTVSASELNDWLESLESAMDEEDIHQPIVIVLGFDYSGGFIDDLSQSGRIVVTSTNATELSFQGPYASSDVGGDFFIDALFSQWARDDQDTNLDLNAAFEIAVRQTEEYTDIGSIYDFYPYFDTASQHPLFDDNGDHLGNNDLNPSGNGVELFQPPEDYEAGIGPMAVAANDFNADGQIDLAVANQISNTVSILLGQDGNAFQEPVDYVTGSSPSAVIAADFNGDTFLDIVTANTTSGDVSVLLGMPNGEFQAATQYLIEAGLSSLAQGDLNEDGLLDLVLTNPDVNSVALLMGKGDGTFHEVVHHDAGGTPSAVALGKFNSDTYLDMAITNPDTGSVSIYLGNGDGSFSDSDGDGILDAADQCPEDPFKETPGTCGCGIDDTDADEDGTFDCLDLCPYDPDKTDPGTCGCGITDTDADNDGSPDCTTTCDETIDSDSDNISDCEDLCPYDAAKTEPGTCGCGESDNDLDADGVPDCNDRCPDDLNKIFPGTTGCGFIEPGFIDYEAGSTPSSIVTADFDNDGVLDLAITNKDTDKISILMGNGDGSFDEISKTYDVADMPSAIAVDNFDSDEYLDIVVVNSGSNLVSVLNGTGGGSFKDPIHYSTGNNPTHLTTAKIDADGKPDLVIANNGSNSITILRTEENGDIDDDLLPDGAAAKNITLGFRTHIDDRPKRLTIERTGAEPGILPASGPDADKATLWLTVDDVDRVQSAWVEIRLPGSTLLDNPYPPLVDLMRINLDWTGDTRYAAEHAGFVDSGKYQLFFFVQDTDGIISSVALPDSYSYSASEFTNNADISPYIKYLYKEDTNNSAPEFHSFINVDDNAELDTGRGVMLAWSAAVDDKDEFKDSVTYTIVIRKNGDTEDILRQEGITGTHYLFPAALFGALSIGTVEITIFAVDDYGVSSAIINSLSAGNVSLGTGTAMDGLLKGRVYNANKHDWRIKEGTVRIAKQDRKLNDGGSFIASLDDGLYTVVVEVAGYVTDINYGIRVYEGDVTTYDIDLVPIDSDGDGVPDVEDAFPYDPTEWIDTDRDGMGNNEDLDDDNDGMPDDWENQYAPPLDALVKDAYEDPDNDRIPNIDEYMLKTDPTKAPPDGDTDSDDDGYPDTIDAFPNDPSEWLDTDIDGIGNNTDLDDDGDNMSDDWENQYDPLNPLQNDAQEDPDGDKIPNIDEFLLGSDPTKPPSSTDTDSDGDGVPDDIDEFPDDPDEWLDSDGDGSGNNQDPDDDNDSMPDDWENQYAPPLNPLLDDALKDPDNDGVLNIEEYENGTDPTASPSGDETDSDGDGIPDIDDEFPDDPDEWLDHDNDGIGNNQDPDDDNDDMPDWWEQDNGLEQFINDALNDPDQDGIFNIDEYLNGTNPKNAVPGKPIPDSPEDGSIDIPLAPILTTQPFYDINTNDGHAETQWQISSVSDFSTFVIDITSDIRLTSIQIPELLLNYGETYYWRVRFFDDDENDYDEVSEWSDTRSFTTINDSQDDSDGDGTPDDQEIDDNQFLDMDGDGVSDLEQDDMGCINASQDGQALCIKVPENVISIDAMAWIDPDSIETTTNRPISMPFGLVSFRLTVIPGTETEVTLFLAEAAGNDLEWYKYDASHGWQNYADYSSFSEDRRSVNIRLKDGDFGDGDGIENGTILDPSGPGSNPRSLYDNYDGIEGNSPYGCFIETSKTPALFGDILRRIFP